MAHTVEDSRTVDTRPIGSISKWLVANDKFMSHWGRGAPNRSLVAYPVDELSHGRFNELVAFCKGRSDFVRVRVQCKLPRMYDGDHLSIYDVPSRFVDKESVVGSGRGEWRFKSGIQWNFAREGVKQAVAVGIAGNKHIILADDYEEGE